ncbi:DUF2809 domain-containing protein [Cellulosimicrobium protaetiae]|uniref:DUF2809 domain-containing protein n=1 Tax=Cellulosimicrobium protaetiae TaxID=2587808 RepID=A0A6M5UKJ2_9MICO|nr:DUF2809 domain-containing protein [Cellulosimicrobium protaetiae]QJW37845.1 DUF2809 domain-containing protein [Cellulosimicrobium protaetiae]
MTVPDGAPTPRPVDEPVDRPVETPGASPPRRRRLVVGLVLAVVVLTGLVVATRVTDPWGDVGGDVLYAVATYVLVVLVLARVRPLVAGAVALGWCWAVEGLQATGFAAAVNDAVPPAAWLLGSTFAVRDLVCYLVGVVLACAVDTWAGARSATPLRPGRSG